MALGRHRGRSPGPERAVPGGICALIRQIRWSRAKLGAEQGAVTAEVAVALPSLVLLLGLLLGAATAGLTQLRLEEAARAGAREVVRGESVDQVRETVLRLAGGRVQLEVTEDRGWSTVTVGSRVALPGLDLFGWDLSASATARAERRGPAGLPDWTSLVPTAERHA